MFAAPDVEAGVAETITRGISSWLDQEAARSSVDHNVYLDNLDRARRDLALSLDDTTSYQAAKPHSHHNRQRLWGEAMIADPSNDFATARHIFNLLMQMSGSARNIRYFQAASQEDYLERKRRKNIAGIDVFGAVSAGIRKLRQPDSGSLVVPSAEEIQAVTLGQFEQKEKMLAELRNRVPEDFGKEESPAVTALQEEQRQWAQLVASSVLMAREYRSGDLAAVPVLEPKSISDEPQVIYPFAA